MQIFWGCSWTFSGLVLSRLFCTLNLNKTTFIPNGYLVSFSRETEKMGEFLKVLQAVDTRAIWMYLARYCNEGMKFRMCIARHIV